MPSICTAIISTEASPWAADAGAKGVSNSGVLSANAGTISLVANVAKNIVDNVNNTGVIEASSAHVSGGTVIIDGARRQRECCG